MQQDVPKPDEAKDQGTGVRIPPPLVYVGAIVAAKILERFWTVDVYPPASCPHCGDALVLAGIALMLGSGLAFYRHKTTVDYRAAATALVSTGPFRFSRNPIYLGLALMTAGYLLPSIWTLLVVPACLGITRWVILKEEAYLERRFGEEYRAYKSKVRRWI